MIIVAQPPILLATAGITFSKCPSVRACVHECPADEFSFRLAVDFSRFIILLCSRHLYSALQCCIPAFECAINRMKADTVHRIHHRYCFFTWPPVCGRGTEMSVSVCHSVCTYVFACMFARISQNPQCKLRHIFCMCMWPVAVVRSFSDDNATRYVLPVLWMTSYLHIMGGPYGASHWQYRRNRFPTYSPGGTALFNTVVVTTTAPNYAVEEKSAVNDYIVMHRRIGH